MIEKLDYVYIDGDDEITYVFLHGWGLSKNSFEKVVQNMDSTHAKILIDLFGFGKSGMPKDYFDTYEYAYQVFLLLKKLCVNKIILVGHSFGGRLTLILSAIFGIDVVSIVLTSSAGLNRFDIIKSIKVRLYKIKKYMVERHLLPDRALQKYGSSDYKNLSSSMKGVFVRVVNQDLGFLCNRITCNTIMVWDKKDRTTKYWMAKKLSQLISNSVIEIYNNGGHFCCFVNARKFAKLLDCI